MSHLTEEPVIARISVGLFPRIIRCGWDMFVHTRPLSVSFSMIFALIGVAILASITRASHSPLIFPISGGFMLVGPFLRGGFFALADRLSRGEPCSAADIRFGFSRMNGGILSIAFVCAILFAIWVINAAYLYASLIGRTPEPLFNLLAPSGPVIAFLLRSVVLGGLLAFFVFAISAFSVPLLYYRRAKLLQAVQLSVMAVFRNLIPCLLWSLLLMVAITVSILIFPLFLVTFPVLAYASHALYREIFPDRLDVS